MSDFRGSKFTRGEKCIFAHMVITLAIIITLLITYIVHVCIVKHEGSDFVTISRRQNVQPVQVEYAFIGVAYLSIKPPSIICNTLLLTQLWSLAPAQCTAMRDDPDMAEYIPWWRIMYKDRDGKYYKSEIERTKTHSHFNRDDYSNNVGLFKHQDYIQMEEFVVPSNLISDEVLINHADHLKIIGWYLRTSEKATCFLPSIHQVEQSHRVLTRSKDFKNYQYACFASGMEVSVKNARELDKGKCALFIHPLIEDLRNYEFCATFERTGTNLDHGAVLVMGSKIVGFFSWGGIEGRGVPLVILQVSHFREWFENIIV